MSDNQTKRHHVTREEEADRDLNGTSYSPGAAKAMVAALLAFVFGVPIVQHYVEIKKGLDERAKWDPKSGQPKPSITPKVYEVFDLLPTRKQLAAAKGFWGYWDLIPSMERISAFEEDLKKNSVLTQVLLSPAQEVLTGKLGVGNEKAYLGMPGWLFYRPDVDYLTADGFLNPYVLRSRRHASAEVQPDPVKAIVDFKDQLAARGITLIVMPMPTKPMIHPEMLVGPKELGIKLQNPSYEAFKSALAANKVELYDPTDLLLTRAQTGEKQYLETDTHWTPDAMSAVAKDLASRIQKEGLLPAGTTSYGTKEIPISALGDIAEMLKLPATQTIYNKQTVKTEQVLTPEGTPWQFDRNGDVLVLGDSFFNIFSSNTLNWGVSSGFAEHLSQDLMRPIDRIAINSGGSYATRRALAADMYQNDRLAGKKVVIYEFSMRDLSQGDWQMIKLPPAPKATSEVTPPAAKPNPPVSNKPDLKVESIEPAAFDPTKGETATLKLFTPTGSYSATIADAQGKTVYSFKKDTAEKDGEARLIWNGKDAGGKVVAPGTYKITVTGTRPDNSAFTTGSATVLVSGGATASKVQAIGATPDHLDTAKGQSTVADFSVPAKGSFQADVVDATKKSVQKLATVNGGPGVIHVKWDGKIGGKPAADGTYAIRLSDGTKSEPAQVKITVKSAAVTGTKPSTTPVSQDIVVTGKIASRAGAPQPGAYKDCVIGLHLNGLKVISGKLTNGDIYVYVWGMRDNKPVDGAYGVGQTITVHLTPWSKAEGQYGSYQRLDDDAMDFSWPTFWGDIK